MIEVTRLNGTKIAINPMQIEYMEETPDTVLLFNSGRKMVLKDKKADIENKLIDLLAESIRRGIDKAGSN